MGTISSAITVNTLAGINQDDTLDKSKKGFVKNFASLLCKIHPQQEGGAQVTQRLFQTKPYCEINPIVNENIETNGIFLSHFANNGCVFTLNYDLLLYWSFLKNVRTCSLRDSFSNKSCYNERYTPTPPNLYDSGTNLFYLHGALHLRRAPNNSALKKKYQENFTLLNKLENDILSGGMPLIVFEGTTGEKMRKINSNRYLHTAYSVLCQCDSKNLFTFGFAFSDNDEHIINAIAKSKVQNLYVGLFGDKDPEENIRIMAKCDILKARREKLNHKSSIEIIYFDSSTAKVW